MELRFPDPAANPYLTLAVTLVAGLDGIENDLPLVPEVKENIYQMSEAVRNEYGIDALPADLNEALTSLAGDDVVKEALGSMLFSTYLRLKQAEWDAYRLEVHPWELKQYS